MIIDAKVTIMVAAVDKLEMILVGPACLERGELTKAYQVSA
jgi:hypothetical protein